MRVQDRSANPLELISSAPPVNDFIRALASGGLYAAHGSAGSSTSLVAGAVAQAAQRGVLLVTAHIDDADEAVDELSSFGVSARRLCAVEMLPGESRVSLDLFAERLSLIRHVLAAGVQPGAVIAAPIHALMQLAPRESELASRVLAIRRGDEFAPGNLVRWLDAAGYRRVEAIEEPAEFAVRGGIIDIFPAGASGASAGVPVRIDFFGDEIDGIFEVDLETMGSDRAIEDLELVGSPDAGDAAAASGEVCPLDLFPPDLIALVHETIEVTEQGRGYFERASGDGPVIGPPAVFKLLQERFHAFAEINQFSGPGGAAKKVFDLPVEPLPPFSQNAAEAIGELADLAATRRVVTYCQNDGERQRLDELIREFGRGADIVTDIRYLHRGFLWGSDEDDSHALVPHHELFHRFQTRRRIRRVKTGRAMDTFLEIEPGDYVVHADHGVAKFTGLKAMKRGRGAQQSAEEFLTLEFAARAKLHVPASQIDKVQKYIGGFRGQPPLSTLGGKRWQKQKDQAREAVRDLAAEMLRIQAAREHLPGVQYPADTTWQREFEAEFPYEETDDQLAALSEIKKDMRSPRPMDRLICGDVGYGKTEVAIRAAFKAAEYGKQIAVLVPTTVLAEQHEETFRSRFATYPFRIESLSRFKSRQEQKDILKATARGEVDILIGTHRILSADMQFADLGLVVIDEEQRFGVEHKQKLLSLRMTVDVLTLSATPIPRTLHMSLLGLRDISSLSTPPMDRRAVVTEVIPYNERRIEQAIRRELNREGQIFFVHNRVQSIQRVAGDVQRMAPGARIVVGHGQMAAKDLESVMLRFIRREVDVLVCTTIIESGIDIPTANTMFISDADRYGLADLHQLRGRVGRHKHRAYCYLLLPEARNASSSAKRRLKAIEEFSMLGAGFKVAMRDLEIRGAGNLLGAEQSGHIAAVGYEMYRRLLERAVHDLKHEPMAETFEMIIEIGVVGALPKAYIPSDLRRMEAYRRISAARSRSELESVEEDLRQAYGEPPRAARRLLELAEIRIGAERCGVREIVVHDKDIIMRTETPGPVVSLFETARGTVRPLAPRDGATSLHEVYYRPPEQFLESDTLLAVLRKRLGGAASESSNDDEAPKVNGRRRDR